MEQQIEGAVVDIRLYNELDGYSVIKIVLGKSHSQARANDAIVTVVGQMFKLIVGESARFHGQWVEDWKYGWQFEAQQVMPVDPQTIVGITKYLSGGMFKGIGKKRALMVANHFGSDTIRILDYEPERIYEISDIPQRVAKNLVDEWKTNRVKRRMMTYIQGLGISANIAQDIFNEYGGKSQETIERNPFLLEEEFIYKIGFDKVDQIARNRGVDGQDKYRLWTGIEHTLHEFSRKRHTCAPQDVLLQNAGQLLGVDCAHLEQTIRLQLQTGDLMRGEFYDESSEKLITTIYLPEFHAAEAAVVDLLQVLCDSGSRIIDDTTEILLPRTLRDLCEEHGLKLATEQQYAVEMALHNKLSILTGGPGTGKTTVLRMLIFVLIERNHRFALAAPTGRAAKRLSQATEEEASTIHRLLAYLPETGGFQLNQENPLKFDIVIIDEASMLDLELFHSLLKAMPPTAHLLLVGDVDQLPSVGAGNVLRDIISSGVAPVTELKQNFRQEAGSQIADNAQLIKQGKDPNLAVKSSKDFYFSVFPIPKKLPTRLLSWPPRR